MAQDIGALAVYFGTILSLTYPCRFTSYGATCNSFRFTSYCISMMHPQDRNVLTCICRDGITDETDLRHCIARRAAGSFYCGRCTPDDCLCGCGPCDGSPDPSSDSDPGYHDPDRTEPWGPSGSEDTTSEGPPSIFYHESSSSEEPEWIPAQQKRHNKRKFCSGYNSPGHACTTQDHVPAQSQETPGALVELQVESTRCPCPAGCLYEGEYGLATCLLCSPQNCSNGQCCCPCAGCYPDSELEENFAGSDSGTCLRWLHPVGHLQI